MEISGAVLTLLPTIWVIEFQSTPLSNISPPGSEPAVHSQISVRCGKSKVLDDIFVTFIYEDKTDPYLFPLFFLPGISDSRAS